MANQWPRDTVSSTLNIERELSTYQFTAWTYAPDVTSGSNITTQGGDNITALNGDPLITQ